MDSELKQYIDGKFEDAKRDLERVETSLLTAFHQWASPSEARARTQSNALHMLDLEIQSLKDRGTNLEKRPH